MPFRRPARAPSVVVTARSIDLPRAESAAADGIAVITVPDNRWERVDIKSISLLPNVLAKQAAREQGAKEAWFVGRDGYRHRRVVVQCLDRQPRRQGGDPAGRSAASCAASPARVLLDVLAAQGLELEERPFTVEEAYARPGGLSDLGQPDRHAGGADRRPAGRKWSAGAGGDGACEPIFTVMPNGPA